MVSAALHRLPVVRDSQATRLYGSLFLLLFASQLLELLLARGVDWVSQLIPDVFDPQIAGAVVSAALGMVALATAFAAVRFRRPASERTERYDVVQPGGVVAILLLFGAYLLHGAADVPVFPGDVVTALLTGGVAMGALAVAYARTYEFEFRLGVPDRETVPLAGAVVATGVIAGVGLFAVSTVPDRSLFTESVVGAFGPQLSVGMLVWRVVTPGVCVGIGMGFLYNGAVQERLREQYGPARATAAVTTLAGVLGWTFVAGGLASDAVGVVGTLAAVTLLSLLGAFVAARGVRPVARRLGVEATPGVAAAFGVAVVAAPLASSVVVDPTAARIATGGLAVTVVAAVACVGYERSDSVWTPVLAFASYQIAGHTDLLLAIARVLG